MHVIPSLGGVGVGNGYNQYTLTNLYSRGINPTAIRLRPFRAFIYSLLPTPYSLSSPTQGPYTPTKSPTAQV